MEPNTGHAREYLWWLYLHRLGAVCDPQKNHHGRGSKTAICCCRCRRRRDALTFGLANSSNGCRQGVAKIAQEAGNLLINMWATVRFVLLHRPKKLDLLSWYNNLIDVV